MTENKTTSSAKTFVIKPVSDSESKNALRQSIKNKTKESLIDKLEKAIKNADKSIDEITLKPLNRIFSATPNNKTMIHLRYGSKVFLDGIVDDLIIRGSDKIQNGLKSDDYSSKKILLNQLLGMIKDDKQFDELYKTFSTKKSSSKTSKNNTKRTKSNTKKSNKNDVKAETPVETSNTTSSAE